MLTPLGSWKTVFSRNEHLQSADHSVQMQVNGAKFLM